MMDKKKSDFRSPISCKIVKTATMHGLNLFLTHLTFILPSLVNTKSIFVQQTTRANEL